MPQFRIRYRLLDGSFVGYHADSFCAITTNPRHAKLHNGPADKAAEWLEIVRTNFKGGWEDTEYGFRHEYRTHPWWKGCGHDQIRLTVEEAT